MAAVLKKAAISFLITGVLSGAFAAMARYDLFDLIETQFYNPTMFASVTRDVQRNALVIDNFFTDAQSRFYLALSDQAIKRTFLPDQSEDDIYERSRIFGILHESIAPLQWVRFIDYNGVSIHYSTNPDDFTAHNLQPAVFNNFYESGFSFSVIAARSGEPIKFIFDGVGDRVFVSMPFYDARDVFRGTALFSISVRALTDSLAAAGRFLVNYDYFVVAQPNGFLEGAVAALYEDAIVREVAAIWALNGGRSAWLYSEESGVALTLLSTQTGQGFFVGRLVNSEFFLFSQTMRTILLVLILLTAFLTVFFILNIKQEPVVVVESRMRKLQIALFQQYYQSDVNIDLNRWKWELQQRKEQIGEQLKNGLGITSPNEVKNIDDLIEDSWNDLVSVVCDSKEAGIDEEKLQTVLGRFTAAIPKKVLNLNEAENEISGGVSNAAIVTEVVEILEEIKPADESEIIAAAMKLEEEHREPQTGDAPVDIRHLSSEIEFSDSGKQENDDVVMSDLEVYSPFSSETFSTLTTLENETQDEKQDEEKSFEKAK
ncbi:MAG: hypothetical protein LBG93_08025 [Treponema sp.]|nr:hypothetical protein [Treponema sp.]